MIQSLDLHTVGDIFNLFFDQYAKQFGPLPKHHYAAANAIMNCRTPKLGGHSYKCSSCSREMTLYNSCRNRHCPLCQGAARAKWVNKRMKEALPVHYFHVVFTIPHQLNGIALRNKKVFYNLMFKAVSQTLLSLAGDPKRLGGETGFTLVLHTWGQNLMDHPHIHCIIPGGAFMEKENGWKMCKEDFLFPVEVVKKLFRGKFMDYFMKAVKNGSIKPFFTAKEDLCSFDDLLKTLYKKKWVVSIRKPFQSPLKLLKYLSRYTHRVAISNSRIIKVENGKVTFLYKDYADHGKQKTMTVTAVEFIRRFMLHIFPDGFMHIRQYGFLSNRGKKKILSRIRDILDRRGEIETRINIEKALRADSCVDNTMQCSCGMGIFYKYREVFAVINDPKPVVID